ncbi:MAG: flagellar hook-length control protein FliK [Anderseniella sp.]
MTMNISTLPVLPKGEAAHAKRNETGAAEFDVKALLKNQVPVKMSGPVETPIEEKSHPDADEEASPDNAVTSSIDLQQLLDPTQVQSTIHLQAGSSPTSSENISMSALARTATPDAAVRVQTDLQGPQDHLLHTDGAKSVEQVTAKAEAVIVTGNSPSIADALSKMQKVSQFAAASLTGSVPQPQAVPVQSVTSISGQFAQSVRILPSSGPVTPAQGKIEVSSLRETADPMDTQPDTPVRFSNGLDRAKVPAIGDRLNAQPLTPQLSGGNVQAAGAEISAVFETPERQIIDAIDDEVTIVGARLKAQAALAVETPASGKLPLLSQIKVDLNPGSLGAVRIDIAMSASGEVEVNVVTAKETTAMMIERGREEVLGGLQSRNVEVRGFNVNTAETGNGTQAGSQQDGPAARFSGHGEGQQSRHVPNGRGDGHANETGPEHNTTDEEPLHQAVRNSGSGIYI